MDLSVYPIPITLEHSDFESLDSGDCLPCAKLAFDVMELVEIGGLGRKVKQAMRIPVVERMTEWIAIYVIFAEFIEVFHDDEQSCHEGDEDKSKQKRHYKNKNQRKVLTFVRQIQRMVHRDINSLLFLVSFMAPHHSVIERIENLVTIRGVLSGQAAMYGLIKQVVKHVKSSQEDDNDEKSNRAKAKDGVRISTGEVVEMMEFVYDMIDLVLLVVRMRHETKTKAVLVKCIIGIISNVLEIVE